MTASIDVNKFTTKNILQFVELYKELSNVANEVSSNSLIINDLLVGRNRETYGNLVELDKIIQQREIEIKKLTQLKLLLTNSSEICDQVLDLLPINRTCNQKNRPVLTSDKTVQCDMYKDVEHATVVDVARHDTNANNSEIKINIKENCELQETDLSKLLNSIPSLAAFFQYHNSVAFTNDQISVDSSIGKTESQKADVYDEKPPTPKYVQHSLSESANDQSEANSTIVLQQEKPATSNAVLKQNQNKVLEWTLANRSNKILNDVNMQKLYKPDENHSEVDVNFRNDFILKSIKNLTSYDLCKPNNGQKSAKSDLFTSTPYPSSNCLVASNEVVKCIEPVVDNMDFIDIYGDLELLNSKENLDELSESLIKDTFGIDDVKENLIGANCIESKEKLKTVQSMEDGEIESDDDKLNSKKVAKRIDSISSNNKQHTKDYFSSSHKTSKPDEKHKHYDHRNACDSTWRQRPSPNSGLKPSATQSTHKTSSSSSKTNRTQSQPPQLLTSKLNKNESISMHKHDNKKRHSSPSRERSHSKKHFKRE